MVHYVHVCIMHVCALNREGASLSSLCENKDSLYSAWHAGKQGHHPCLTLKPEPQVTLEQDPLIPNLQPGASQLEGCDQTKASLPWESASSELGSSAGCAQSPWLSGDSE